MNTPHERLARTTFSLPLGEVHALVGGAVNGRPLLFLHGFPDHPATAVPFLEHLADTHRVVAPCLRRYAPPPSDGPEVAINRRPATVIKPPLKGDGWLATTACCTPNLHRDLRIVVDGRRIETAETFAVAWAP